MNSIKCKKCGLKNFADDFECRRCRTPFMQTQTRKEKTPRRFSIWSLLMIASVAGVFYYFYNGVQAEMQQINANEAKRVASQPAERPLAPGLSRTQYDQQRSGTYADAVRNSQSLADHNKHIQQTEKAMQQISNSSAK